MGAGGAARRRAGRDPGAHDGGKRHVVTDIDTLRQTPQDGLQPLALRAMFWRPDFLADSPWLEHIPVAFWLVEAQRPRVIVELGPGDGTSYFAFCQAVDRLGLDTRCFAAAWPGGEGEAGPQAAAAAVAALREHSSTAIATTSSTSSPTAPWTCCTSTAAIRTRRSRC